jgi:hypothetical protein
MMIEFITRLYVLSVNIFHSFWRETTVSWREIQIRPNSFSPAKSFRASGREDMSADVLPSYFGNPFQQPLSPFMASEFESPDFVPFDTLNEGNSFFALFNSHTSSFVTASSHSSFPSMSSSTHQDAQLNVSNPIQHGSPLDDVTLTSPGDFSSPYPPPPSTHPYPSSGDSIILQLRPGDALTKHVVSATSCRGKLELTFSRRKSFGSIAAHLTRRFCDQLRYPGSKSSQASR